MNTSVNTSTSQTFSFPLLKKSEIVSCCNELNIPITENDLTQPHLSVVRTVYELFVELLTGISKDQMQQIQFSALDTLSFPELYEEAIPEVTFLKHV